jgi:hypothetical protein
VLDPSQSDACRAVRQSPLDHTRHVCLGLASASFVTGEPWSKLAHGVLGVFDDSVPFEPGRLNVAGQAF